MSAFQDGPFGKSPNVDVRVVLAILVCIVLAVLTFVGDQATFARAPKNGFEYAVAFVTSLWYRVFQDRLAADVSTFCLFAALIIVPGSFLMRWFVRKVIWRKEAQALVDKRRAFQELVDEENEKREGK